MSSTRVVLRCLVLALVSALVLCDGRPAGVSKEEYLKMKEYLRKINKRPVKSITTKHGHVFDCVDIYKQPALDHPLLQNHTIKLQPSSISEMSPLSSKTKTKFGLPGGGCPKNTVPIKRIHIEDLLRAGSISNFLEKPLMNGHKYAVMSAQRGSYLGTEASLSLWNPQISDPSQFSLTQLWLLSNPSGLLNTIEVGWHAFPGIYNDYQTHLFTYWTSNGYQGTGCYNLMCPGFVQVSQEMAPGSVLEPVSTPNGDQHELHLYVYKDKESGDWWLTYGKDQQVGYWPNSLFNGAFDNSAYLVQWGGEAIIGSESGTYPPMGSGSFAEEGYGKSAYVKDIQVVDASGQKVDAPIDPSGSVQTDGCYDIADGGNELEGSGRAFYYGGPGGACN